MSGSTSKTRRKAFSRPYRVGRSRTGLGGFATRLIKKNELIDRYRGQMITTEEADKRDNRYMFEVNSKWTIDGSNRRNLARYFNHSCRPNAESDVKGHKVIIVAKRTIQPGEEITYDYGKDYFDIFLKPIGCKCDKCLEKRAKERAEKRAAAKAGKTAGKSASKTKASKAKTTRSKTAAAEARAAAADKKQVVKRGKTAASKAAASKAAKSKTKAKTAKTKTTKAKATTARSKVKQAAAGKSVSRKTKAVSRAKTSRKKT